MAKKSVKLKPTPIIRAKVITVRGLLNRIKREILAEPKRANLNSWISMFAGEVLGSLWWGMREPACGTIGCLAGWGAILLRPLRANPKLIYHRAGPVIGELIGYTVVSYPTYRSVGSLFASPPQQEFGETDKSLGYPGTVKHAKAIARRIDLYLERHPEVATRKINVAKARKMLAAP